MPQNVNMCHTWSTSATHNQQVPQMVHKCHQRSTSATNSNVRSKHMSGAVVAEPRQPSILGRRGGGNRGGEQDVCKLCFEDLEFKLFDLKLIANLAT